MWWSCPVISERQRLYCERGIQFFDLNRKFRWVKLQQKIVNNTNLIKSYHCWHDHHPRSVSNPQTLFISGPLAEDGSGGSSPSLPAPPRPSHHLPWRQLPYWWWGKTIAFNTVLFIVMQLSLLILFHTVSHHRTGHNRRKKSWNKHRNILQIICTNLHHPSISCTR